MPDARVFASTVGMDLDAWLEARRHGVGSSDAPGVCGLDPWNSPLSLWLDKTGQAKPREAGEAAYWGTVLEPVVAEEFARQHPEWRVARRNAILQHPTIDHMLLNVDRLVRVPGVGHIPLEIKTTSAYAEDDWDGGGVPDRAVVQVQHSLAVLGAPYAFVAALIGGQRYVERLVPRDDRFIGDLLAVEADFWNYVQSMTPPPADGSDASRAALLALFPEPTAGKEIALPPDASGLLAAYDEWSRAEKAATTAKQAAQNALCALLGDAETGLLAGERVCTWKQQHRDAHMVGASDFRQFRRVTPRAAKKSA